MKWTETTLANGLKALHIKRSQEDQRFYFAVVIKTGARYEAGFTSGVSHFLEHMMFRGSQKHPSFAQLADAFEWLGGEWNAETGQEHTEYSYEGVARNYQKVIELFADFIMHPMLADIETERSVILREIEDGLNDFGLSVDLDEHLSELVWPNSPLSRSITGSKESVASITIEELRRYRDAAYTKDRMILVSAGPQSDQDVFSTLEQHFAGYPLEEHKLIENEKIPEFIGPAGKWVPHTDSQYHFQLSFLCSGETSAKSTEYDLMARILSDGFSSRLCLRLREELGLVYDVDARVSQHSDFGTFDIDASITCENLPELVHETLRVIEEVVASGFDKNEFEKAKCRSEIDLDLSDVEPEAIGFRTAWCLLLNEDPSLAKERRLLADATLESTNQIAKEVFQKNGLAYAILGPVNPAMKKQIAQIISSAQF